jgi:predicted nucleic-acid-binding Zn-ribbon protein
MALEWKRWTEVLGALYSLNALLPAEYRVIISDQKYNELTRQSLMITCQKCGKDSDYNKIKIQVLITRSLERFVSGQEHVKMWTCTKCHNSNYLSQSVVKQTVLSQPYYLGVVPYPPRRQDGVKNHLEFDRKMERWAWTMLSELEEKMAQYRDDNWDRGDNDTLDGVVVDTSWEQEE